MIGERRHFDWTFFAAAALCLAACQREEPRRQRPPDARRNEISSPSPIAVAPAAEASDAADGPVMDGGDAASAPPLKKGAWLDGGIYKLRFEGLRDCGRGPAARGASFDGEAIHLGAAITIRSQIDDMPISPRDFTFEGGLGVLFRGNFPDKPPSPRCGPPIPIKVVRGDKSVTGVVVFDLPPDFKPQPRTMAVVYQPTRWGGARPVRAPVPDCLALCPDLDKRKQSKARARD